MQSNITVGPSSPSGLMILPQKNTQSFIIIHYPDPEFDLSLGGDPPAYTTTVIRPSQSLSMKKELERYVSRSPPYNPASGNKVRNPPRSQGLATDATYRSSGAPGAATGRPPAVTANVGTTAQPKRK
ncbi:hypothetical protein H4582DRAFT_2055251 [Lactarius indigo]|nr:hypothetical protein H4582DRAFT_2055251 [Lactarius indigo]